MAMFYLAFYANELKLCRVKTTITSHKLTIRNIGYQCKIGFSALIGEVTMALLLIVGNIVFMKYLGDAGVGAYGVACYYMPFVFIFGNSIAQSAQPIISYNFGLGRYDRVRETLLLSCRTAVICSLFSIILFTMLPQYLVHLFIAPDDHAAQIAIKGFPYFATGFLFFIMNLVAIGFLQSIKRVAPATVFALMRGVLFLFPAFLLLPKVFGVKGIWLAVPLSEMLTSVAVVCYALVCMNKR